MAEEKNPIDLLCGIFLSLAVGSFMLFLGGLSTATIIFGTPDSNFIPGVNIFLGITFGLACLFGVLLVLTGIVGGR